MYPTIKEQIEGFYFTTQEDADQHDPKLAVGGIKTINGIFVSEWGLITKYKWINGTVEVKK